MLARGLLPQPAMPRIRLGLLCVLLVVVLALAFDQLASAASKQPRVPSREEPAEADAAPAWDALQTSVAEAARERWIGPFPATIELDEATTARIGSPVSGRVAQIFVGLGAQVRKGQPLFTVVSAEYAALRTERERLALEADAARDAHERTTRMVEAHALAGKEALESHRRLQLAETSLRQIEARLRSTGSRTADGGFTVLAPKDGMVVQKDLITSEHVTGSGKALITLASMKSVRVASHVFEADALGIAVGARVRVTTPSLPGFSEETRLEWMSSVVDPARHTVTFWTTLPNPELQLRANMQAEVTLLRPALERAVEVNASALVSTGSSQYVYVKEPSGAFSQRSVQAAAAQNGRVVLLTGVEPGEHVVERGVQLLENHAVLLRGSKGYRLSPCLGCF